VRNIVSIVLYPLQRLTSVPGTVVSNIGNTFATNAQLRRENTDLKQENELTSQIDKQAQALQAENSHLRELLALQRQPEIKSIAAEILYTARDVFTQKVVVDKGSSQGILPGQAVVDNIGLIGQVTRVHWLSSEISLITDKEQVVPVQVVRTGLRGVLFGTGQKDFLELRFLPINTDIQNGDTLVTSGVDGSYPMGLPVAIVATVERNAAYAFARILCAPAAGVNHHKQVLMLSFAQQTPANTLEAESKSKKKSESRR
jgi:rod shape-determining protein MreC